MADYNIGGKEGYRRSPRMLFVFGSSDVTLSKTLNCTGKVHSVILVLPNFVTATTCNLSFFNAEAIEFYTSGAKADNTTWVLTGIDRVFAEDVTLKLTLDAVSGGIATATLIIYFDR